MRECSRKIHICTGHRVHGHESKCAHWHGHNYVIWITAGANALDGIGRVIDFSVLKGVVGKWLDENWDHRFLLWEKDETFRECAEMEKERGIVRVPFNPTAENMAQFILEKGNDLLKPHGVILTKVVVWETENCYAEAHGK